MLEILWGLKTTSAFDVWSIEHVLSGISVGTVYKKRTAKNIERIGKHLHANHPAVIRLELIGVLFIAYLWEAFEHYFEQGLLGARVAYWFQGTEFWMNRLITDPLMLVVGYYFAKRYPVLVMPARFFSIFWTLIHVFVFPHSMYLQQFF